jgi:hypothetical protein
VGLAGTAHAVVVHERLVGVATVIHAEPDLRLQLLPVDLIDHGATDTLRDAGGGLVSRLVRRSGRDIVAVTRADAAAIQGTDPFATAAEQTFTFELSDLDVRDHGSAPAGFRVLAIDGSPFVSTALLWPDTTAQYPGMTDALVCAPRLSTVFVRPVLTKSDIGAAGLLASVAGEVADGAADRVFWWHLGRFHLIDFDEGDGQPVLPAELGPIVDALPG